MLRKVIPDSEIPITMPIRFALNSSGDTSFISAIGRSHSCQGSVVAAASNVSSIILVSDMDKMVDIGERVGVITVGNAQQGSKGVYRYHPINPKQHIFTTTESMSVKFFVHEATGYRSMTENAAAIGDNTYFPLNTIRTPIDYVRVLPSTGDAIEVRYYNGMTPELFLDIWNTAQN